MLVMGPGGRANEGLSANLVRTMRPRASACPPCSIWDGAGLLALTTQDSCPVKAVLDLPSGALPSHLLQLWTINRDARNPGKGDGVESRTEASGGQCQLDANLHVPAEPGGPVLGPGAAVL